MQLRGWIGAGATLLLGAALAAGFLYWDRTGAITRMIMNSGSWLAILIGILLMTIYLYYPGSLRIFDCHPDARLWRLARRTVQLGCFDDWRYCDVCSGPSFRRPFAEKIHYTATV